MMTWGDIIIELKQIKESNNQQQKHNHVFIDISKYLFVDLFGQPWTLEHSKNS